MPGSPANLFSCPEQIADPGGMADVGKGGELPDVWSVAEGRPGGGPLRTIPAHPFIRPIRMGPDAESRRCLE